jgi:TIR domain
VFCAPHVPRILGDRLRPDIGPAELDDRMRIFLSFNSKDMALAEAIRTGLSRIDQGAQIFFSPISLGAGFWLPKLAEEIAQAEAFLLLIGPAGIGPWQEVEYFTAFDRHVIDKHFPLVPVMVAGAEAPGLSFLRTLNWVEAPFVTEDKVLHRLLAGLSLGRRQGHVRATGS